MAWIPMIKIDGGLYGGSAFANGTLTGFVNDFLPYRNVSGHQLAASNNNIGVAAWEGAYGLQGGPIIEYALDHNENETNTLSAIILDIDNPEGAQFYKQQLILDISIRRGAITAYHQVIGGVSYDCTACHIEINLVKIKRYEFYTPYSDPTVTDLTTYTRGLTFEYIVSGDWRARGGNYILPSANRLYLTLGPATYNQTDYYGFGFYTRYEGNTPYRGGVFLGVSQEYLAELFGKEVEPEPPEDPNEEDDPPGPGSGPGGSGGNGDHNLPDEPIPVPELPYMYPGMISWLQLYKMSLPDIDAFGSEFVDPTGWNAIKTFFTDPLDAIVGITLVPVDAPSSRTRIPSIGGFTWSRAFNVCGEFVEVDCGYLDVPPYWDSAFDFEPYTKLHIFLPFIGYKEITIDEVMGGKIGVKYHVDVCTGDCTAFVTKWSVSEDFYGPTPPQVIAQFNGNCAVRVPIGRVSHDAAINASMSLFGAAFNVAGGIAGAALGDVGNIGGSQIANQVSSATMTAVNGMKTEVSRSGNIAGVAGYLGILKPYIIRQIPRQVLPSNYKRLEGYPANKGGTLSQYTGTGLQAVEAIELNNITCFDSERDEIISLLKGGVLV